MPTCLETARLYLRPLQADDWQAVLAYTADPAVLRYLPEGRFTADAVQQLTAEADDCPDRFAINLKADGNFIGHILFCPHDSEALTRELGWVIQPRYQRRGYATEAAAAVLRYGVETLGLQRVVATCDSCNFASMRVMEKLCLRREAEFKACLFRQGEWLNEYQYAILASDWRALQAAKPT